MIKRKKDECKDCLNTRQIYAKGLCGYCYQKQRKKTPLPRPTKPILKESAKRKKERPIYAKKSKKHKQDNPYCQAKLDGCAHRTTETHHMAGRGVNYLDESKFLAVCNNCHQKITEDSALAIKLGLSYSRLKK